MNPLLSRLASLRRKVRLLDGWQGISALLTLLVGAVLVAGLLDWLVQLPSLVRGMLLVGILVGAGMIAYRLLFVPFRSPCDDLTLALRIEKEFPELNDALGSTVQFLSESADSPGAAASSQAMRKKAVQEAVVKAEQYDFSRIISYRSAVILGVSLVVVAALAAHFAYRYAQFSGIALVRLADPFGGHTWTTVDIPNAPDRVAVGQPYAVKAVFSGVMPQRARVEIVDLRPGQEQQRPEEKNIELKRDAESLVIPWDVTKYNRDFKFRVMANDGSFPRQPGKWHTVSVLEPPSLVNLDGQPSPQIAVIPPAYTEEPSPQKLTPGTKMIKAWAGSAVVFRAATDRPVTTVWFEYRPRNVQPGVPVPAFRAATLLGQFTSTGSAFFGLGDLFGGQTAWERVPAEIDADGTRFTVRFTAWTSGACVLHLEDKDRLPHKYPFELDVDVDPPPTVKLLQPATEVTLLPDAEASFRFQAEDEIFALRSVYVEYKVQKSKEDRVGSAPRWAVLETAPGYERGLPQLTAPLVLAATNSAEPLKLKPKRIEVVSTWALRNQFKVGDIVTVEVCGDDYCDIYGTRTPGRSHQVTMLIVSKGELAKVIDEKLKQFQQDLKGIKDTQKEALDIVKEVEGKKKFTEQDVDRIVEAEQKQKVIQEKVGDADQGLRQELNKLQQMLKDNKMKDTEAQQVTGMMKGALDQLARQELPQIDQALAEARKKLANQANKDAKDKGQDQNKKEDPLEKSTKLQNSALKNLNELDQALAPWKSIQEAKEEVRSILEQQHRIKKELDKVKTDKDEFDQTNPSSAEKREMDKEFKNQLEKDAAQLQDLAKRAGDLKTTIDKMEKSRREKNDKESADRLKEAAKIADKAGLQEKMKDVANELKETADNQKKDQVPSNQAQQKQQKNIDNLEKMLAALEGRDDAADALRMKQNKQAQDKVEKLAKEMQDLKNQNAKNNKDNKDDEEKLQSKRKELAKQFDELKDKLEEEARELARLQEPRASKDVADAAKEAGDAAKKLGQGQDPGDEQKNAKQDLEKAKQALKESEDELAREQLAKIADRIKGLKERQDQAIERSKEFHKRLLAKKTWTDAFGKSLDGDGKAQDGLARETRSLKEKIKEARVFEHIMDRAAKSMDEAAAVMNDRRKVGIENRQYDVKAGKTMPEDEVEDENDRNKETLTQQTQAAQRLQRLLDAVKEELAKKPPEPKEPKEGDMPPDDGPKLRAGDGIPAMAQLKALRAEQMDLNERTEDYTRRNPDTMKLKAEQKAELEQLQQDQRNLQELFLQITATPENKGDAP